MNAPAIRTSGLSKTYGTRPALLDLDLEVPGGQVIGYLGSNGAGKTTTIRLLLGLIRPTSGRSEIFGIDSTHRAAEAHRHLAYVPGEANLWPGLTGEETLGLLGKVSRRVDESYRDQLIERFDLDTTKKIRNLSRGNRQKVILIAAIMTRAELLLFDEPTSGLDPLMEQVFRECVNEARDRGQTVFLSSHMLSEVEAVCDRVAILRAGRLIEVGLLSDMRHLSTLTVQATFAGTPPPLDRVPGVLSCRVEDQVATLQVAGDLEPLLTALTAHHVQRLTSREPSLEELFSSAYRPEVEPEAGTGR